MKVKDFFGKDIDVNCYIKLWNGIHDDHGKLLANAYGNENEKFEAWYDMDVTYLTLGDSELIIEVDGKEKIDTNDIVVQFARLWGQLESATITAKDEDVSDCLKSYDSKEVMDVVRKWADEYLSDTNEIEDSCDFFYKKVEELTTKDMER